MSGRIFDWEGQRLCGCSGCGIVLPMLSASFDDNAEAFCPCGGDFCWCDDCVFDEEEA